MTSDKKLCPECGGRGVIEVRRSKARAARWTALGVIAVAMTIYDTITRHHGWIVDWFFCVSAVGVSVGEWRDYYHG